MHLTSWQIPSWSAGCAFKHAFPPQQSEDVRQPCRLGATHCRGAKQTTTSGFIQQLLRLGGVVHWRICHAGTRAAAHRFTCSKILRSSALLTQAAVAAVGQC